MNPQTSFFSTLRVSWKEDLLASIVVFLVALPLSMGIAIASGVPIEKAASVGLVTAIIGGIVVGTLSGCALQVSGPAAGLAVMVALFIEKHGFETLGLIVLLGGLIQLAAGVLRLGQVFRAVSPALIQGMLAGIGVLIFAAQFHVMVDDLPPGTGKEFGGIINLWTLPQAVWKGVSETVHRPAALIGLATIVTMFLWNSFAPQKLKLLPAPLFGVVVGTACAALLGLGIKYVPVPGDLLEAIRWPTGSDFRRFGEGAIWLAGLSLAFVASAESLLTATAVDSMQRHAPRTRYDRELTAQGIGNILCGLAGVLPLTGVIVRSSANVLAGARTRLSAVLHGVWVLVFIVLLPDVLRLIPVASLAAVLVYTGLKLMNPKAVRTLWRTDRAEAGIYAATLGTVVVVDLLTGIAVGIGLALARLLYTFSHLDVTVEEERATGRTVIRLKGAATFIRLPKLAAALEQVRPDAHVHVYFHELTYIDHACLDLLVHWEQQHKAAGGELVVDWNTLHAVFQQHAWGGGNSRRVAATQG
ncbi:MAG TPA: SulP family inorganic anion transporter [Methylococcus sp.]|nr:SulP family inorganic anion transporter [Methylococcus sp.]